MPPTTGPSTRPDPADRSDRADRAGAQSPASAPERPGLALASLLLATFMGFLDLFIVNVAAPSIQRSLPATFEQVQLVLSGYIVAYAVGLVTGGRLGDTFGRRRLWLYGVAGFVATSIACGLATSATMLILARVLQGLAAALMLPQVMATIQVLFEGERRSRALGLYGGVIGLAALSGQIVGGALIGADVAGTGWRAVFFVNVPLGILALAVGARTVPQTRARTPQRLDLVGAALLGSAVACLLYPLVAAPDGGWSLLLTVLVIVGAGGAAGFVVWERRAEATGTREPLLRPSLFSEAAFRWGLLVVLAFYAGNSGFFLVLAYFLQSGLHLSAVMSGVGFLPVGAGFAIASVASGRLVDRWGDRVPSAGAGLVLLSLLAAVAALHGEHGLAQLCGPLFVSGLGEGLIAAPLIGIVLRRVDSDSAGAASGALLTTTQIANLLSIALTGSVFELVLGDGRGRAAYDRAFTGSLLWLCLLAIATLALLAALSRSRRGAQDQAEQQG